MDPLGKRELLNFYNKHLKRFGDNPQSLRWTINGQRRRYDTLVRIAGNLFSKTILDFGCGKGDFFGFIKERCMPASYCGIDVNQNLIRLAKRKYPEAEFIAMDLEEENLDRKFDIIFACGVFNLRIAGIEESLKKILKILFSMCREAVHLNLLTFYVPNRTVELFYVKPEEIVEYIIKNLSRYVRLFNCEEDIYLSVYHSSRSNILFNS